METHVQTLQFFFFLPGHSCFLYLRLRCALHAHRVLWDSAINRHTLMNCLKFTNTYGAVSLTYNKLLLDSSHTLPLTVIWDRTFIVTTNLGLEMGRHFQYWQSTTFLTMMEAYTTYIFCTRWNACWYVSICSQNQWAHTSTVSKFWDQHLD